MSVETPTDVATPVRWLSRDEFAREHPEISPWLVGEMIRRGELEFVRAGKRRLLVRSDALDRLAERQRKEREAGHDVA